MAFHYNNEKQNHSLIEQLTFECCKFLGSRAEGENAVDQAFREAQWKEDHACSICGRFECDGHCEDILVIE